MNFTTLPNDDTISSEDELPRMLEAEEGPSLTAYDDNAPPSAGNLGHNPSIGHGFNLRITNNLALVLNQITIDGQNVFFWAAGTGANAPWRCRH